MTWTYVDMWKATVVYGLLSAGAFVLLLVSCAVIFYMLSRRAKSIFSDMTQSLLRAPVSVLYQTPIGEILARYSTDMQIIDGFDVVSVGFYVSKYCVHCSCFRDNVLSTGYYRRNIYGPDGLLVPRNGGQVPLCSGVLIESRT